jgi:hypothetical protein
MKMTPQCSAYMPLHRNLGGEAGKGRVTGEAVGAAATDTVEGGNRRTVEEKPFGLAP